MEPADMFPWLLFTLSIGIIIGAWIEGRSHREEDDNEMDH